MEIKSYSMNWHYPTAVRVGAGRISELPKACRQLGMTSPLLVTDPGLAALPMVEAALQLCRDAGLQVGLFSAIKGNPTGGNVADGVTALKAGSHDGVIAFGGGSAIDAAKAIALVAHQDCTLWKRAPVRLMPARCCRWSPCRLPRVPVPKWVRRW